MAPRTRTTKIEIKNIAIHNECEPKRLPQYLAALSGCIGSIAFGTVLGWTGNILINDPNYSSFVHDEWESGMVCSLPALGALIICIPMGYFCNLFGRKLVMLSTVIPFMIGWGCIIFQTSLQSIYWGRFILGCSGGSYCIIAPLYSCEIAQMEIRGRLGMYYHMLLTVGILYAYIAAYLLDSLKYYAISCAIWPIVFFICLSFQPQSPFFLLKMGKDEKALAAMQYLRGMEYDSEEEIKILKLHLVEEKILLKSFKEELKTKAAKRALIIMFGFMFFQQFSGSCIIIFYTKYLFDVTHVIAIPDLATIATGTIQVIAVCSSTMIIDRVGRKLLLLISLGLSSLFGLSLGLYYTFLLREIVGKEYNPNMLGGLHVTIICFFMLAYSFGLGPIPWLIAAEIFSPRIKTFAISLAATFNWVLTFIIINLYVNIRTWVGDDVICYVSMAGTFIGFLNVYWLMPETKGKTLRQIQDELNGVVPAIPMKL